MRRVAIQAIKGDEVLAQDIMGQYDTLLMSAGVVLKQEYVNRLEELGIQYIYVEDRYAVGIEKQHITELKIKELCQKQVHDTLNKYANSGSSALEEMKEVAQDIITDLLEEPQIMYNVAGVRQKAESAYSHSINVAALSAFIALCMEIEEKKVREIAIGSLLHDIGYSNVKINIREKKYTDYSEKEKKEMEMHVIYGFTAIEYENWLSNTAKEIILHHHENINGTGYPMHIDGTKMKIGAKIVAVCDTFDRLIYGDFAKQMKVHEAVEYIYANSGKRFDEQVVKVFNTSIAAYPTGTTVKTNMGEIGIVLRQNPDYPTRPIIRVLKNSQNNFCDGWVEKDLLKELSLFIVDTVDEI